MDPITTEVLRNKFELIIAEMQLILQRSAQSAVIKEARDLCNAIFDLDAEFVAYSSGAPFFVGLLGPAVSQMMKTFPPATMHPEDVYITNSPYQGGTHIPDTILVAPAFYKGSLVALVVSIAHQVDMGGMTPGSKPMEATEIFQEGLVIPPTKLYAAGKINDTLMNILRLNSRQAETVENDLLAQLAACRVGQRRLVELCDSFGVETVLDSMRELLDRTEEMVRGKIAEMPETEVRAVGYLDHDNIDLDKFVEIAVRLKVQGSELTIDLTGSSPQTRGPINSSASSSAGICYCTILNMLNDPTIPVNGGFLRPIKVILPPGSVVNPVHPAPVNARVPTCFAIFQTILAAFRQVMPEKTTAASGLGNSVWFVGTDPLTGKRYTLLDFAAGGVGAKPFADGISARGQGPMMSVNIPTEVVENDFPIYVKQYNIRQNSGGAGKNRGGDGVVKVWQLARGTCTLITQTDHTRTRPSGALGGEPGEGQVLEIKRANGALERIPSRCLRTLAAGDELTVMTPGGGGFGKPEPHGR